MVRLDGKISGPKLLEWSLSTSLLRRFCACGDVGLWVQVGCKGTTSAPSLAVYQAQLERNEGVLLADD